jgi:DNA/RNA endonuclease YhcR with UshA esterase domain
VNTAVICVKEKTLIIICILGSVVGISSLYLISFMIVSVEVSPGDISQEYLGRKVKISGTVQDLRFHRNGHIFFKVADEKGSTDVVIWEERLERLELSGANMSELRNDVGIQITGDVEYYRGNIQVVV